MAINRLEAHVSPLFYPLHYNFCIGFELLIRYKLADYSPTQSKIVQSPHLDEPEDVHAPVRERVIEVLREARLEVNDYNLRDPDLRCWTIRDDTVITPLPHNRRDEHVNILGFCPMEIVSPVLRFEENSFANIKHMLCTLRRRFKLIVNSTCGLRVRVGSFTNQHHDCFSAGFPLQTLRNFAQLVTLFEFEINGLHPMERVLYADYCLLPSQLIKESEDALTLLDKCGDLTTLNQIWQQRKSTASESSPASSLPAYSISDSPLEPDMGENKHPRRMIVFRQHAGTIEYEEVYHWVKLAVQLVRFSQECGPGGIPAPLLRCHDEERHWPTGSFNTISFLKAIGAVEQAEYYRDKLKQYPRPLPRHFSYKEQKDITLGASPEVVYPDRSMCYVEEGTGSKKGRLRSEAVLEDSRSGFGSGEMKIGAHRSELVRRDLDY